MDASTSTRGFANANAGQIHEGATIIERNIKGMIVNRVKVTEVDYHPPGCSGKIHVHIVGGKTWCYDRLVPVELQ